MNSGLKLRRCRPCFFWLSDIEHPSITSGVSTEAGRLIFLYFPSRAQRSSALRLFVDAARELATHAL